MTTLSAGYPDSANALACELASLASSTTAGRSCVAFVNTTFLFPDVGMTVRLRTNGSEPTGVKGAYIYVYVSVDGTNFSGSSGEAVGTDAAVTFAAETALHGPFFLPMPAASTTYQLDLPSFAAMFGVVPAKGGVVINNQTGNALSATAADHSVTWTAHQPTSA